MKQVKRLLVGITGFTGSGKTVFAECLRKQGAEVIDVDVFVHGLYEPGKPLYAKIIKKYPHVTGNNGSIDRKKLGRAVFADKVKYRAFTAIVYPEMNRALEKEISKKKGVLYLDMAVLFESGFNEKTDRIIYIGCAKKIWEKRVLAIKNKDYAGIRKFQEIIPGPKKIARSDYIIYNEGTKRELCKKAADVFAAINREFYGA